MLDNYKKSLLAISIFSILQGQAFAQEESKSATEEQEVAKVAVEKDSEEEKITDIDVITVTGTRGSLQRSLNAKRFSDKVMDGISAEDIGKLPDNNIAEALSRVVGVSLDRSAGEGQYISIRGMDPSLSNVTVNGQGMASSGSGSAQGQSSRAVNLNNLGSEMVSAIEVFKSPTANMIEGSIGGTVNLRSRSPIQAGNVASASVKTEYNDNSEDFGDGLNLMLNGVNDSETFGANFTFASFNRTTQKNDFSSRGWTTVDHEPYASTEGFDTYVHVIDDIRAKSTTNERERINAALKLQWFPTEDLDIGLNLLYANQESTQLSDRAIYNFRNIGSKNNKYLPRTESIIIDDGNVVRQVVDTVNAANNYTSQGYDQVGEDETISANVVVKYNLTDNLQITTTVGSSTAENETWWITPQFQTSANGLGYDLPNNSWQPEIIFPTEPADIANLEPEAMEMKNISWSDRVSEDTQEYAQIDLDWQLDNDFFSSVEFGVRYNEGEKDWNVLTTNKDQTLAAIEKEVGTIYLDQYGIYKQVDNMLDNAPVSSWFAVDTKAMHRDLEQYAVREYEEETPYNIVETTYASYAQANIDMELLNTPIRGNVGVRYVKTEVESSANKDATGQGDWEWQTLEHDYDDFLPSLNLAFILSEEVIIRTAAAKVMSRPNHRQLASTFYIQNPGTIDTVVRVGNPYLSPYRANQYDLSAEWYFNANGMLAAGVFVKDIKNFIIEVTEQRIIEGENDNWPVLVKQPTNSDDAEVKGIELSYQQAFDFLPSPFDGLGTSVNYTYNESDAVIPVEDISGNLLETELPGFSKDNVNAMVYFEKYGMNMRLSYNYRSSYFQQLAFSGEPIYVDDFYQFDFSAGYKFTKQTSISFNARNLTEENQFKYVENESRAFEAASNGRTYTLTLSHRF